MDGKGGGDARKILSDILGRIEELSEAINEPKENKNPSVPENRSNSVDDEVRKVFNHGSNSAMCSRRPMAKPPTGSYTYKPQSSPAPAYTMKRNYSWKNPRSSLASAKSKKLSRPRPFTRDMILLSGPDDVDVPRQSTRLRLEESGHVICQYSFSREWNEVDVELNVREAFGDDVIPADVDIEFVYSVHCKLLKPTLAATQSLNGDMVSRIFKDKKPVYVRPSKQLLQVRRQKKEIYDLDLDLDEEDEEETSASYDTLSTPISDPIPSTSSTCTLSTTTADPYLSTSSTGTLSSSPTSQSLPSSSNKPSTLIRASSPTTTISHPTPASYYSYLDIIDDQGTEEIQIDDDDPDLIAAKAASMEDVQKEMESVTSVQELIQKFIDINLEKEKDPAIIVIRRRDIMSTTLKAVERKKFSFVLPLLVNFSGEEGVDAGGPKREFFHLLMSSLKSMGIFEGRWFSHDIELLSNQKYAYAGKLISWSILHGGSGPKALSSEAFKVMKDLPSSSTNAIQAISDEKLQKVLQDLESCSTPDDFERFKVNNADAVAEYGYNKIYVSGITHKEKIIRCLLKQAFVFSVNAEIHQFIEGLNAVGKLGDLMLANPNLFEAIMCESHEKLCLAEFSKLYIVEFSEVGSNKRELEDQTVYSFEVFLKDLEDGEIEEINLGHLLMFITGADCIPPLGFHYAITVKFYDVEPGIKRYPWSSTCALTLNLPRGIADSDTFKDLMCQCLVDCQGFGRC